MRALATEYRPNTFEDVVEQSIISEVLKSQIENKTFMHGYLLKGPAGTGKTTLARIFANELNDGQGTPIEVDGASNNGVDAMRELISLSKVRSQDSEYKIIIVDECHMLSNGAWNVLLKTLEEPNLKTVWLFCTTDPQKIPSTILSRVQQFELKRISTQGIYDRLVVIADNEAEEGYDVRSLEYITKVADGGMRDAITLLDKALSTSGTLDYEAIIDALGFVNYDTMVELTNHILNFNPTGAFQVVEDIHGDGADLKQFVKQYVSFLLDVSKFCMFKSFDHIQSPVTLEETFNGWATTYGLNEFSQIIPPILGLNTSIKWEASPKPIIQATLLMLCTEAV